MAKNHDASKDSSIRAGKLTIQWSNPIEPSHQMEEMD